MRTALAVEQDRCSRFDLGTGSGDLLSRPAIIPATTFVSRENARTLGRVSLCRPAEGRILGQIGTGTFSYWLAHPEDRSFDGA
jgi:hypothetical protein